MYLSTNCYILSLTLSICIAGGSLGADGETVLLKSVYRPGQEVYLETNRILHQRFVREDLGPLMETHYRQVTGMRQKVVAVSESGETELELTFERLGQVVDAMQSEWRFDSDGGRKDILLKRVMAPLIGKKVTLRIAASGKPLNLEGMVPILEDMEMQSVDDAASAQFFDQIKADFSDAAQRFVWADMSLGLLPNRPVTVGDTWKVSLREPLAYIGAVLREYTCTLESLTTNKKGRRVAQITYQGKISVAPDAVSTLSSSGLQMEYLGGTLSGIIKFDLALSLIFLQDERFESTQSTETPDSARPDETQRMTIEQTGRTLYRRLSLAQRAAQKEQITPEHRRVPSRPPPQPSP